MSEAATFNRMRIKKIRESNIYNYILLETHLNHSLNGQHSGLSNNTGSNCLLPYETGAKIKANAADLSSFDKVVKYCSEICR
jgi:hypothetical protein